MPKKILLADDSITIQKVVELTFSDGDYEVVAVNNGAKAIQKLSEMRPDIILSDIIMPEKNGYEVCEYVKSHPDFRTIPVVLLTGTFEPFDPDRADKAGCDAVVTKPFESQSLIHKVEELIDQSRRAPAVAEVAPEPVVESSPWADETAAPEHGSDIFGAAASAPATSVSEMPFETSAPEAFSGETRAFPRMSFEDMQKMAAETAPPPAPTPIPPAAPPAEPPVIESSPWDEQPPAFGGETPAFAPVTFDEPAAPPPAAEPSPWDEQPSAFSGETRAFSRVSFEDMQRMAAETAPEPPAPEPPAPEPLAAAPAEPEPSPWTEPPAAPFNEEPAASFSGETRAFPRMSFDDIERMASEEAAPAPSQPLAPEPSPWGDQAASPFHEPPSSLGDETSSFGRGASPFGDEMSVPHPAPEPEAPRADSSMWSEPEPEAAPAAAAASEPEPAAAPAAAVVMGDLTEEQIDRIARRVVQMLSADVVKNIAWEVIPDMAEMVVKERIRQLESEA
jgi:CheY-like chemotaxis protein